MQTVAYLSPLKQSIPSVIEIPRGNKKSQLDANKCSYQENAFWHSQYMLVDAVGNYRNFTLNPTHSEKHQRQWMNSIIFSSCENK
jgi:hypothetical protein